MAAYKLDEVVSEWIVENGKTENHRPRLYTIAVSGLRELNMDVDGITKIVELCVNDNDTVDLPEDFMNYSKIGIVGDDGRMHCLGRDNNISLNPVCGLQGRDLTTQSSADNIYYGQEYSGAFYGLIDGNGGLFGIGGGNNALGYYRLNRNTNQLWLTNLNTLARQTIVMEYIADVNSVEGDFVVNPFIIQTIKDYISWKYIAGSDKSSLGEKQIRRSEYYNSRRIAKVRYAATTVDEWAEAFRKSNTASVRF